MFFINRVIPVDSSVISFSLKFSLFKLGKEYRASGTLGKLFWAKSTSDNRVKFSKFMGKLFRFRWVFLRCKVSKLTKEGNCLNWKCPMGLLFKMSVCKLARRLVCGGKVSKLLSLRSRNSKSVRFMNSELGIVSILKSNLLWHPQFGLIQLKLTDFYSSLRLVVIWLYLSLQAPPLNYCDLSLRC